MELEAELGVDSTDNKVEETVPDVVGTTVGIVEGVGSTEKRRDDNYVLYTTSNEKYQPVIMKCSCVTMYSYHIKLKLYMCDYPWQFIIYNNMYI